MTTDDVAIVHAALAAKGWAAVARALGVTYRGRRRVRCPLHNGGGEHFTFDEQDGRLTWICATHCGAGDVLSFIGRVRSLRFREALAEAASIAGVQLEDHSDETDEQRQARERERAAYLAASKTAEPDPEPEYPPEAEVLALWLEAGSVADDPDASGVLVSRLICPDATAQRVLARAFGPRTALPAWATYGRVSWAASGHRMLVPVYDTSGKLRSVRAWRVTLGDTPKRLPPHGYAQRRLVLANAAARELLAAGPDGGPRRVVVVEGEPDFLVHATRSDEAVIGVGSGSWSADFAARIPFGSEVVVRTHRDDAGDRYAAQVIRTCRDHCAVLRALPVPSSDSEAA